MTSKDDRRKGFSEKRDHPRQKVKKEVRVEVDGEVVVGETKNISLSGVAVNSLVVMTTEQFVNLHLEQLEGLPGHVVRQMEDGFAVEFETVEDNGSVLEDRIRKMLGNQQPTGGNDDVAEEKARMEAHLRTMLGGDDD